jgi:hypothetical protein
MQTTSFSLLWFLQCHRYRKTKNRLLKFCFVPVTSAAHNKLLFFLFLLWPFTVVMKQTRQAVHVIKQSIFLDVYVQCHDKIYPFLTSLQIDQFAKKNHDNNCIISDFLIKHLHFLDISALVLVQCSHIFNIITCWSICFKPKVKNFNENLSICDIGIFNFHDRQVQKVKISNLSKQNWNSAVIFWNC